MIFIAITAAFYNEPRIARARASTRTTRPSGPRSCRSTRRRPGTPTGVAAAAKEASVNAFHLAALVSAALMAAGSAVSAVGLRKAASAAPAMDSEPVVGAG